MECLLTMYSTRSSTVPKQANSLSQQPHEMPAATALANPIGQASDLWRATPMPVTRPSSSR
eukprot:10540742-Prorocentrum_lima.AAC.1